MEREIAMYSLTRASHALHTSRTSHPRYGPRSRHMLIVATRVVGWTLAGAAALVIGFLLSYPVVWGCALSACSDVPQPL